LLPYQVKPIRKNFWKNIFPDKTVKGKILEFSGIENFVVSLNVECDSPQIARLHRIFPNLKIFRHIREQKKGKGLLGCCEHKKKGNEWKYVFEPLALNEKASGLDVEELVENLGLSGKMEYHMGKPNLTIMSQFYY
jgi:hypothetical protein